MKLTLRTLIAFLDGTMSDEDTAMFRKKIRESEAIGELIHRIRAVISQPQLPSPKSAMEGIGKDPNYSSEYIDSTLDLERVAEFEKLTIGSDILLAEVAEVHQILAGLPKYDEGISERLRIRLKAITDSCVKNGGNEPQVFPVISDESLNNESLKDGQSSLLSESGVFELAPPPAPPIATSKGKESFSTLDKDTILQKRSKDKKKSRRARQRDPVDGNIGSFNESRTTVRSPDQKNRSKEEQDRQSPKALPVIVAICCVTSLLVLIAISFMRPDFFKTANNNNSPINSGQNQEETRDEEPGRRRKSESTDETNSKKVSSDEDSDGVANQPLSSQSSNPADPVTKKPAANDEKKTGSETSPEIMRSVGQAKALRNGEKKVGGKQVSEKQEDEVLNFFRDKKYDEGEAGTSNNNKPPVANSTMPAAPDRSKSTGNKKQVQPAKDPGAASPPSFSNAKQRMSKAASLVNGEAVGTMKSKLQPTLRRTNLPTAKWIHLENNQPVHINDTVVALPECQSRIEIGESIGLDLLGYTRFTLQKNETEVLPLINVSHGMIGFENLKAPNNSVDVALGGKKIQVTMVDKNSKFGVVVSEPSEKSGLEPAIQIAAVLGRVLCKLDGEVISLDQGHFLNLPEDTPEPTPFSENPLILSAKTDYLTKSAKESFYNLSLDNPVFDIATAKAISDGDEVRNFAVLSAFALGDFRRVIDDLDREQRAGFREKTILFGRQQALINASFRGALMEFCKTTAATESGASVGLDPKLIENWSGFLTVTKNEELEKGMARRLVDALDSPALWIRVTSIQTLSSMTGKTELFHPEDNKDQRRKSLKVWEKALEDGEVKIANPPRIPGFR